MDRLKADPAYSWSLDEIKKDLQKQETIAKNKSALNLLPDKGAKVLSRIELLKSILAAKKIEAENVPLIEEKENKPNDAVQKLETKDAPVTKVKLVEPDLSGLLSQLTIGSAAPKSNSKNPFSSPSAVVAAPELLQGITSVSEQKAIETLYENIARSNEKPDTAPVKVSDDVLIKLLPHQVEGLSFLTHRERPDAKTKGGLLCDDQGLGKTVQILSLVVTNRAPEEGKYRTTLIVCPLSTLSHWENELLTKVKNVKFLAYYGKERTSFNSTKQSLADYDVVLTTYGTLAADLTKSLKLQQNDKKAAPIGLYYIHYWRVVLDEAHIIKNSKTKTAKAAFSLRAEHRWCLTGTPVQNSLEDIFSLLHFVRTPALKENDLSFFRERVSKCKEGPKVGLPRLQAYLLGILLRRTKAQKVNGKPLLDLPPITYILEKVKFSPQELAVYDSFYLDGKRQFSKYIQDRTVSYANILEILLRMRQICDHPKLVSHKDREVGVCAACFDEYDGFYQVSGCSHQFCKLCVESLDEFDMGSKRHMCPVCNTAVTLRENSSEKKTLKQSLDETSDISTKMERLSELLKQDSDAKSIVFSQFTSFMDLLEQSLQSDSIRYVRLDGTMSHEQRARAITMFKDDTEIKVFLLSLKAGGVGLNLTEASRVYLLDPWWNPAVEQQAIDRVYRIGQTRPVVVTRLVVQNSVEERILQLHEKKRQVANSALADSKEALSKLTTEDLKLLFR